MNGEEKGFRSKRASEGTGRVAAYVAAVLAVVEHLHERLLFDGHAELRHIFEVGEDIVVIKIFRGGTVRLEQDRLFQGDENNVVVI